MPPSSFVVALLLPCAQAALVVAQVQAEADAWVVSLVDVHAVTLADSWARALPIFPRQTQRD